MGRVVGLLVVVLFVLHHDFWNWSNQELVFGVVPVGLAYHAGFSVAAALLWLFAINFAWPSDVEAWAEEGSNEE